MAEQTMDQQHQSALSQVNNVIDKGKSAYNNAKRLKKAVQVGRTAVQGVQTGVSILVALFSSGVGEILLVLLAIAIGAFLLVIVVSIITGASNTNAGEICTTQTITITGTGGSGTPLNVNDYFSVTGGTTSQQNTIKNYLQTPLSYSKYPAMLKVGGANGKVNINIISSATCFGRGWACTYTSPPHIEIPQDFFTANVATQKHYLIHETGHYIDFVNGMMDTGFYPSVALKDPIGSASNDCYTPQDFLRTYPFNSGTTSHEDFAEAMADTIRCGDGQTCPFSGGSSSPSPLGSISNFPSTCSNTYNWMVKNVVGVQGSGSTMQTITVCVTPTSGPSTAPVVGGPFPWSAFDTLVAGQGRNTTALGNSATAFVNTVKSRVGSGTNDEANSSYLTQIYNVAVAKNVNPAILLTIWGVEQNFKANTSLTFGCFYDSMTGFSLNLQCAVNTLDNHMNDFKTPSTQIHSVNPTYPDPDCTYTDMFSYAYDWYTPVCHKNDNNDPYRKNFISIYKKIMGL